MDRKLKKVQIEYQMNHPNCEWCIWYKYNSPSSKIMGINCSDYETCELKEKMIYFKKMKAKFCKYYYVEGEDEINEI